MVRQTVLFAIKVRTGKWITASDAVRSDGPFKCGCCGSPVSLRDGLYRASHFAHAQHQAKPDCEEYHPSSYGGSNDPIAVWTQKPARSTLEHQIRVGFQGDSPSNYAISLLLPSAKEYSPWEGKIVLPTARGEIELGYAQLSQPGRLTIPPALELMIERRPGCGVNLEYWNLISNAVPILSESGWTYFNDSAGVGNRLQDEAPLHCGDSYWAISTASAEAELACLKAVELLSVDRWIGRWWVHRFQLKEDTIRDSEEWFAAEKQLEREILLPSPRLTLVDPPPHHITSEGQIFVATPCDRLLFKCNHDLPVAVESPIHTPSLVKRIDHGVIEVSVTALGEWTLRVDGYVTRVLIGEAPLFRPPGILATIGGVTSNLVSISTGTLLATTLGENVEIVVELPNTAMAGAVRVDGREWPVDQQSVRLRLFGDLAHAIDAGAFGWIDTHNLVRTPKKDVAKYDNQGMRPLATWLASVASVSLDGDGATEIIQLDWEQAPSWLQRFRHLRWSRLVAPQLRYFVASLEKEAGP